MSFARGDRVRQIFRGRSILKDRVGTIIGKAKHHGDWLVKFDDDPSPKPRLVPVYERDLIDDVPGMAL
jgi:hypothetical protein